jgi:hypothetical protein
MAEDSEVKTKTQWLQQILILCGIIGLQEKILEIGS